MFRKHKYIPFILAAVLAACSDDFEPTTGFVPDGSVSFSTYIGNAVSRASVVDASALQSSAEGFGVMASLTGNDNYASSSKPNFMYNQQVVYGGGSWNYSPLKYWPASANEKISFFAYAPYVDAPASPDAAGSGITALPAWDAASDPVIRYEFGSDIGSHIDLLYAAATDMTNEAGTVNFEFRHALSRIGFKVCGWESDGSGIDFDDNTTVTVNAVTLSTLRRGASLNLYTGEWSENLNGELQGFTLDGAHLQNSVIRPADGAVQINTSDSYMMIAPDYFLENGNAAKVYCVLVDYTVETTDPSLHAGKLVVRNKVYRYISPNFEPGKAYTVNIHLGMGDNAGSGDDCTDVVGPAPIDPNPEDPTVPSTGGENSYVKFSASVTDWDDGNKVVIPLAPATPAVFTASQVDLHIEGSFAYEDPSKAPDDDTLTLVSMVKEGTTENLLFAEQNFPVGAFSIPTSNINLESLESGKSYTLTLRNAYNHIYTVDVPMLFGMMQMTIEHLYDFMSFTIPLKGGASPAKLAFVWGDGTQTGELDWVDYPDNRHTYPTKGIKVVRILSSVHESTGELQIPAFNFSATGGSQQDVISIDTPILRTGAKDFAVAFKNCINLKSVHPGLLMYQTEAEDFMYAFYYCSALEELPAGFFDYNTKAVNFRFAFDSCTSLRILPEGLFDNCTEAEIFNYAFNQCSLLENIPDGLLKYNVKAKEISNMFSSTSVKRIPDDMLPPGENLTAADCLFSGCTALTSIPRDLFCRSTGITSAAQAFDRCSSITSVPEGLFRNNRKLKNINGIFSQCTAIESVPKDVFDSAEALENVTNAFLGCSAITSEVPELWNRLIANHTQCYRGVTNAANYDDIPDDWK